MNKTLDFYLSKGKLSSGDVRYMQQSVKDEIDASTPNCVGGVLRERFHWLVNKWNNFPECSNCSSLFSTKNWCRQHHKYSKFCNASCAAKFRESDLVHKQKMIEKFGVAHPLSSKEVQLKRKATNIERFGTAVPNPWGSNRFKNALVKKHGVDAVRSIPGINEKIIDSHIKRSKQILLDKIPQIEKEFDVQLLTEDPLEKWNGTRYKNSVLLWKHNCGKEYHSNITFRGIRKCPSCSSGTSELEQEILSIIQSLTNLTIIHRDRTTIAPYELDIVIPELKLAIEIDGSYWHSAKFQSASKAVNKVNRCQEAGYRLITVQESVFRTRPLQVISRLKSALGLTKKLHARKCKIIELPMDIRSVFFNQFHTSGDAKASFAVGLIYEDVVVAMMSFGRPRFNRGYDWEIIRAATADGITVVGGISKMIKYFMRLNSKQSLLTYADRCWGDGASYEKSGMKFIRVSSPSYFYAGPNHQIVSRYKAQKKNLVHILKEEFNEELSESENMEMAGYMKVFDRGTSVYAISAIE